MSEIPVQRHRSWTWAAVVAFSSTACCCIGGNNATNTPLGVSTPSDNAQFTYVATAPGGAFARGANRFEVDVRNPDGTPAVLTHVEAEMPAHGHLAIATQITDEGGGRFQVSGLDLLMAGGWMLQFTLSHTGATDDDRATLLADVP